MYNQCRQKRAHTIIFITVEFIMLSVITTSRAIVRCLRRLFLYLFHLPARMVRAVKNAVKMHCGNVEF